MRRLEKPSSNSSALAEVVSIPTPWRHLESYLFLLVEVGVFNASVPTENPSHVYHFTWNTTFACPLESLPKPQPVCCGYEIPPVSSNGVFSGPTKRIVKRTCNIPGHPCSPKLGPLTYSRNTTVSSYVFSVTAETKEFNILF